MRERRRMCIAAAENVQDILAENYRLKSELNTLRTQIMGPAALQATAPVVVVGEALTQLLQVKDEAIGASTKTEGTTPRQNVGNGVASNPGIPNDAAAMFGAHLLPQQIIPQNAFQVDAQGLWGSHESNTLLDESFQLIQLMEGAQMPWNFNPYLYSLNQSVP